MLDEDEETNIREREQQQDSVEVIILDDSGEDLVYVSQPSQSLSLVEEESITQWFPSLIVDDVNVANTVHDIEVTNTPPSTGHAFATRLRQAVNSTTFKGFMLFLTICSIKIPVKYFR